MIGALLHGLVSLLYLVPPGAGRGCVPFTSHWKVINVSLLNLHEYLFHYSIGELQWLIMTTNTVYWPHVTQEDGLNCGQCVDSLQTVYIKWKKICHIWYMWTMNIFYPAMMDEHFGSHRVTMWGAVTEVTPPWAEDASKWTTTAHAPIMIDCHNMSADAEGALGFDMSTT